MQFSETLKIETSQHPLGAFGETDRQLPQTLAQLTLIPLVCVSILAPFIPISPALPSFRVEILLLPVIFFFYGWLLLAGYVREIRVNGMFLVGAVYGLCLLISTMYGAALLGQSLVPQDFYEFPKLILPVAFFTVAYEANLSELGLRRLLLALGGSLLLICIYAWGQWGDMGFSRALNEVYTAGKHVDDALVYARRVYSTMGNPNVLGELLVWAIAAFLLAFLARIVNQTFLIFILVSALITLSMTGSRYGILNASLAIALVMFMPNANPQTNRHRRRKEIVLLFMLLPIFAGAITLVAMSNPRILERYQTLSNPLVTDSTTERFDKLWLDALNDFYKSPILGRGPAKDIYADINTDSEYLGVLKQFGLLGLLAYLAYYIYPLVLVCRGLRAGKMAGRSLEAFMPFNYLVMRLGFVMIITALVMNIGMSTFYNQLLQGFLWIWMGLSARASRNIVLAKSFRPYLSA
ncbi:MAG TPA: O-antigen ligase family protein [Candidatus Acidoferrum sp.]|nr:O-antigen ligase family protein [Candidatus Acidoferrum sp.]